MKFTDASSRPAGERASALDWFRQHAGDLDHARYFDLLFNLSASLAGVADKSIPVVSIAGSQGSGKSTLAELLAGLLSEVFSRRAVTLSIDDFYLPRAARLQLAADVHPMLAVRGVPGTHDVAMMAASLDALRRGDTADLPVFDKATDDRSGQTRHVGPADVIVCEGWCWGARPQPAGDLARPVNELEAAEDPQGTWRRFVNDALAGYQQVFRADGYIYLQVPSMDAVYRWRWQQEQQLAGSSAGSQIMDEAGVRRFIACYERLTRWMLIDCPPRADVLVQLGESHEVTGVRYARP